MTGPRLLLPLAGVTWAFLLGWLGLTSADAVGAKHCTDAKKHALGMCVDREVRGGWTEGLVVLACQLSAGQRAEGKGQRRCQRLDRCAAMALSKPVFIAKKCVASVNHWLAKTTSGQFR